MSGNKSSGRVRDVHAEIDVEITDYVSFERETEAAQFRLEPPQALSPPLLIIDFQNASVEVELDDYHVDMLGDYVHQLRQIHTGNQQQEASDHE